MKTSGNTVASEVPECLMMTTWARPPLEAYLPLLVEEVAAELVVEPVVTSPPLRPAGERPTRLSGRRTWMLCRALGRMPPRRSKKVAVVSMSLPPTLNPPPRLRGQRQFAEPSGSTGKERQSTGQGEIAVERLGGCPATGPLCGSTSPAWGAAGQGLNDRRL